MAGSRNGRSPQVVTDSFLAGVREAEAALRGLFEPTPLQRNDYLSAKYGADVWLKREDLSPVRSYKIRGAFNAMRKALAARARAAGASSAPRPATTPRAWPSPAAHFGAEGVVFMPVTTPQQKIDKTRQFGGGQVEIRLVGDYFDDTLARRAGLLRRRPARSSCRPSTTPT